MFFAEKSLSLLLVDQRVTEHFAAPTADQQPRHYQQDELWWGAKNSRPP